MDIEKLIKTLRQHGVSCVRAYRKYCSICDEAATALSTLQAENNGLKEKLYIVEKQRDAAIEELEKYMVQDLLDGNEPCGICAKASDTPCEYCDPKWRGQKEG